jgi:hypothetical protein
VGASGAEPKRVLFIHSFGRDFAPYHAVSGLLRTELASQMAEPIELFDATLDSARFTDSQQEVFPWCLKKLLAGEVIPVSFMDALPAEASCDRESWLHKGAVASDQ